MFVDKEKHNQFIDFTKGIAIFLMILGHCIQYLLSSTQLNVYENWLFKFIYSFHMPLFMLISGYLFYYSFNKRDFSSLISRRSKPLLFSIVFCGLFNYYITTGLYGVLSGDLGVLVSGAWLPSLFDLWFLWSVLIASFIVALICKYVKNIHVQIILITILAGFFVIIPGVNLHIFVYPYFVIGFYFAKYKNLIPAKFVNFKYLSLPIFFLLLCFYREEHYIYTSGIIGGTYSIFEYIFIDFYRWAIGLIGSIAVLSVVGFFFNKFYKHESKNRIVNLFSAFGKNSLQIYCLSNVLVAATLKPIVSMVYDRFSIELNIIQLLAVLVMPVIALVYTGLFLGVVKVFDRIKLSKILFGK